MNHNSYKCSLVFKFRRISLLYEFLIIIFNLLNHMDIKKYSSNPNLKNLNNSAPENLNTSILNNLNFKYKIKLLSIKY
jgi:hypothetical protein